MSHDPKHKPIQRRDATGHLNPEYAKKLHEESGHESTEADPAFLKHARSKDSLAEELGEEAVAAATSGGDDNGERLEREVVEEEGGPFVTSTSGQEMAEGTDASNPKSATKEPFPRT